MKWPSERSDGNLVIVDSHYSFNFELLIMIYELPFFSETLVSYLFGSVLHLI